ncbi:MAG: M23 family metallopeptidase [Candidatus Firestonebacteria bacterium]|nr:M23 family metallopeptidase [Candidatus Firestonebacteria bacterium]
MKKEPLTIMVVPHTNGEVHNFKIPLTYIYTLGGILAVSLLASIYFIYDYTNLRGEVVNLKPYNAELIKKNKMLEEDKKSQELELKDLNKILVQLKKFDNKLRIMTGLKLRNKDEEKKDVGGQGGPVTKEDISILKEKMYTSPRSLLNLPPGSSPYKQILREFILQKESFQELQGFLEEQEDLLNSTPSIWPLKGWIISEYGRRISPFTGGTEMHEGIDISAMIGSPVKATADGIVEFAGFKRNFGNIVIIDHSYGFKTFYGHNEKLNVRTGQRVKRGQVIATLGNSGQSIRPHLHYEIIVKGEKISPRKYLIE